MNLLFSFKKSVSAMMMVLIIAPAFMFVTVPRRAEAFDVVLEVTAATAMIPQWMKTIFIAAQSVITSSSTTLTAAATSWMSWIKTLTLDTIAAALKHALVAKLTQMGINFVRNGFNGGPTYVQNPGRYYGNVTNSVTQVYLKDLDNLKHAYSPENITYMILNDAQRQLEADAYQNYRQAMIPTAGERFPGSGTRSEYDAYVSSFNNCPTGNGWDCWNAMSYSSNNPWDIAIAQQQELQKRQYEALTLAHNEINAANGFATVKSCVTSIFRNNVQQCVNQLTKIPGKVIVDQLAKYQASSLDELHNMHDFTQVIATALVDAGMSFVTNGSL